MSQLWDNLDDGTDCENKQEQKNNKISDKKLKKAFFMKCQSSSSASNIDCIFDIRIAIIKRKKKYKKLSKSFLWELPKLFRALTDWQKLF
jgi:hypothetical protein